MMEVTGGCWQFLAAESGRVGGKAGDWKGSGLQTTVGTHRPNGLAGELRDETQALTVRHGMSGPSQSPLHEPVAAKTQVTGTSARRSWFRLFSFIRKAKKEERIVQQLYRTVTYST